MPLFFTDLGLQPAGIVDAVRAQLRDLRPDALVDLSNDAVTVWFPEPRQVAGSEWQDVREALPNGQYGYRWSLQRTGIGDDRLAAHIAQAIRELVTVSLQ